MRLTVVPGVVLRLQYAVVRVPLGWLGDAVPCALGPGSAVGRAYQELLVLVDDAAGRWLGDETAARRAGAARARAVAAARARSVALAQVTVLGQRGADRCRGAGAARRERHRRDLQAQVTAWRARQDRAAPPRREHDTTATPARVRTLKDPEKTAGSPVLGEPEK